MERKSSASALLSGKCPRCRKGEMFPFPATDIKRFNVMNKTCPHCGVRLEPEPGFYQGAMYVSYAFTVAVISIVGMVLYVTGDPSEWVYVGVAIGVMVLLIPWNYRFARIVYLYAFGGIKYDPSGSRS